MDEFRTLREYIHEVVRRRKTHFVIDNRRLADLNDRAGRRESMKEDGGYYKYSIKLIPVADIDVPPVWNPGRFDQALKHMKNGDKLDPIRARLDEKDGKWKINDGIHRANASIEMGYSHVPVFVEEWVDTPDKYVKPEPEKPQLAVGDWVKFKKPQFGGFRYAQVEELLPPWVHKGVKRWRYGLKLVSKTGSDSGDFQDGDFDPVIPPRWAILRSKGQ